MTFTLLTWDLLRASAIFGGFLLLALLVRLLWMRLVGSRLERTGMGLDDSVVLAVRGLVTWGLVLLGFYCALASLRAAQANPRTIDILGRILAIAWVLLAIWTLLRGFTAVMRWFVQHAARRSHGARDVTYQSHLIGKTVHVVVIAVGLLYILRLAGVDISPLLASGAIGGLAVALALQDTLTNLFAGIYLTIDRPARVGDFIRLETGQEGYVEDIGWRHTVVRVPTNNVVVIPNTKLSQAVITNYSLPRRDMVLSVDCGVGYDSDLDYVESVTLDVARSVQQDTEGADRQIEPAVRWKEFADSAITFTVVLRVNEFQAQHAVRSAFMKALHRRFQKEGIEIPFPMRTVLLKKEVAVPVRVGHERNAIQAERPRESPVGLAAPDNREAA